MKRTNEVVEQRTIRYKNPLATTQRIPVWVNNEVRSITFAPGEEKEVPSEYEWAIHHVHDGQIIGGEAPQLINLSRPELKLAGYLDTEAQKRAAAKAELINAQLEKQKAEQAALLAAAKAAEAEAVAKAAEAAKASETKPAEKQKA